MADGGMSYRIVGLDKVLAKLTPELVSVPVRRFFDRAGIAVTNRAKDKAPVDTGRLRSSIAHEVDSRPMPLWCKVGTNLFYAPYMEFGTGTQTDGDGGGAEHWPPWDALNVWASRHGFGQGGGFLVARAIGLRGGLTPRRFLRGGLEESLGEIQGFLQQLGRDIRAKWES